MQLFWSPTSPYVRKVVVLLKETGQESDVEFISAAGSPMNSDNMPTQHNPLGKIPALTHDDGPAIYDSRVICRFFDERAGGNLYPDTPRLWETLTLESLSDGVLDAAILMVYEGRIRPETIQMPEWLEAQWAKINRALDALESDWMDYMSGPLCMGQVALGCSLSYLDFRLDARNWRDGRPNLAAWEADFAARPAMKATVPIE